MVLSIFLPLLLQISCKKERYSYMLDFGHKVGATTTAATPDCEEIKRPITLMDNSW